MKPDNRRATTPDRLRAPNRRFTLGLRSYPPCASIRSDFTLAACATLTVRKQVARAKTITRPRDRGKSKRETMNNLIQNLLSKICASILRVHSIVKIVEPWSILITALAFVITTAAFIATLIQLYTDRSVREATLIGLASDRLEAARELDISEGKIAKHKVGQIRMLEIMADSGISLRGMNLSYVNLRGAQLPRADLRDVDFECADLAKANLTDADLSDADLTLTNLFRANFKGAHFTDVDFDGANLHMVRNISKGTQFSGASFRDTRLRKLDLRNLDLTKDQLSSACGSDVHLPEHIGGGEITKCSKAQRDAQKCE